MYQNQQPGRPMTPEQMAAQMREYQRMQQTQPQVDAQGRPIQQFQPQMPPQMPQMVRQPVDQYGRPIPPQFQQPPQMPQQWQQTVPPQRPTYQQPYVPPVPPSAGFGAPRSNPPVREDGAAPTRRYTRPKTPPVEIAAGYQIPAQPNEVLEPAEIIEPGVAETGDSYLSSLKVCNPTNISTVTPMPVITLIGNKEYADIKRMCYTEKCSGGYTTVNASYVYFTPNVESISKIIECDDITGITEILSTGLVTGSLVAKHLEDIFTLLINSFTTGVLDLGMSIDSFSNDYIELQTAVRSGFNKKINDKLLVLEKQIIAIVKKMSLTDNTKDDNDTLMVHETYIVMGDEKMLSIPEQGGSITVASAPKTMAGILEINEADVSVGSLVYLCTDKRKYLVCFVDEYDKAMIAPT